MKLKTLNDVDVKGKKVLIRVDINSPVVNGLIEDNPRFEQSAKTISYLVDKGAKVVIIAHQGRKGDNDFLPLEQHAKILTKYCGKKIRYIDELFEDKVSGEINKLKMGDGILLKNVREYNEEKDLINTEKYEQFCKQFDLYVNDAFSVSHRKQGSIMIPPRIIPGVIGLGFEKEINALSKLDLNKSSRTALLIGGVKIKDYLPLFNMLSKKDNIIIASGVLANLILMAKGIDLGFESKWLKDNKYDKLLSEVKKLYEKYKKQIVLPVDFGLIDKKKKRVDLTISQVPFKYKIMDIGPASVELYKKELAKCKTIIMKGPLGFSEIEEFSYATREILSFISKLSKEGKIFSILGGGHLSTTMEKYKIEDNFNYISLSGGAFLEYISGKELPGIKALYLD